MNQPEITGEVHKVMIKDWNFVQEHNKFVSAVPDMEPFCGKEATIIGFVVESPVPELPNIYTIFEDGGKYWWCQEWLEKKEDA